MPRLRARPALEHVGRAMTVAVVETQEVGCHLERLGNRILTVHHLDQAKI